MSLPAADVKFLLNITQRMAERSLQVYVPGKNRSAIAIILRFGDEKQQCILHHHFMHRGELHSPSQFMQHLSSTTDANMPSSLRMLFVRRADLASDRWSGNVTFPGGRRDEDDADDFHTVCREVNGMLGIPLRSKEFLLMGRLRDYPIRSRHIHALGAVQSRFVFLHLGDLTPTPHFARHLVDSMQWMPISALTVNSVEKGRVCHPVGCFARVSDADSRLLLTEVFPHAYFSFPSVQLPGQWRVWGLALRSAGELLSLDERPPIDWPLVSSNSTMLQHFFIDAFHGYYEVVYACHRAKARLRWTGSEACTKLDFLPPCADSVLWAVPEHIEPRHIFFFCIDVLLAMMVIYSIAGVIFFVSTAFCMALGFTDVDGTKQRLHAYHVENTPSGMERERWEQQRQQQMGAPGEDPVESPLEPAAPFPVLPITSEATTPSCSTVSHVSKETGFSDNLGANMSKDEKDSYHTCSSGANDHDDENALHFASVPTSDDWDAFRKTVAAWAEQNTSGSNMCSTPKEGDVDCNNDKMNVAEGGG